MASSVDLGANLEQVVTGLVTSGRYNSRSEILREGVRLVQERERRLEALDAAIAQGLAEIEAGLVYPLEEVAAELDARYAAMVIRGHYIDFRCQRFGATTRWPKSI